MNIKKNLINKLKIPVLLTLSFWFVFLLDITLPQDFKTYGLYPRTLSGLKGIFFAPFIHGDFFHLLNNTLPFFILSTLLYSLHRKHFWKTLFSTTLMTESLAWIVGRNGHHIGASGMIYSFAFFIIIFAWFKRDLKSILISLLVIFFYGGALLSGLLPFLKSASSTSLEKHFLGAVSGIMWAYISKREIKTTTISEKKS